MIDAHHGILYKIGRSFTSNESDFKDLYQEMLIQLWQSFDRFKGNSKRSTWMYRVALNTAMTFSKKHQKYQTEEASEATLSTISDDPFTEREYQKDQQDQINRLYQAINMLKKEERVIVLLHMEGKQYDEISEIIGITTSNVGVKLLRSKKKLLQLMQTK